MNYTEMIERLRDAAKIEQSVCEADGITTKSGHVKLLEGAADAIETLQAGINGYCNAAFNISQENTELRKRLAEKEDQAAEECESKKTCLPDMLFVCDRRACETCTPECSYTFDARHAKHFEVDPDGCMIEQM